MKVGDVVKLKSNSSPIMTVVDEPGNADYVICAWFINGEYKHINLRKGSLIVVPPASANYGVFTMK